VPETRCKDGVSWRIGTHADVDWIAEGTEPGHRISAAIPPVFAAYATLTNPGFAHAPRHLGDDRGQDLAFVDLLRRHSGDGP
jgi:hypothetical protein